MEIAHARQKALALMARHGLHDWSLVFDNAKTRSGICRAGPKEIGLSRVLTKLHSPAEVTDTILHEIAHALVGPHHGHDRVWYDMATLIGSSGARRVPATAPAPEAPWRGVCPLGHVTTRFRRPQRVLSCVRCSRSFSPHALIEWRLNGRKVPMHPRYLAELSLIQRDAARLAPLLDQPVAVAAVTRTPQPARPLPHRAVPVTAVLAVGTAVRLAGAGRYAGLVGTIEKRARTRYHLRTELGLVTAPFAMVEALHTGT